MELAWTSWSIGQTKCASRFVFRGFEFTSVSHVMNLRRHLYNIRSCPARMYRYVQGLPPLQKLVPICLLTVLASFGLGPVLESDVILAWLVFLFSLPVAIGNLDQTSRTQLSDGLRCISCRCRVSSLPSLVQRALTTVANARIFYSYQFSPRTGRVLDLPCLLDSNPSKQFLIPSLHAFRPPPLTA